MHSGSKNESRGCTDGPMAHRMRRGDDSRPAVKWRTHGGHVERAVGTLLQELVSSVTHACIVGSLELRPGRGTPPGGSPDGTARPSRGCADGGPRSRTPCYGARDRPKCRSHCSSTDGPGGATLRSRRAGIFSVCPGDLLAFAKIPFEQRGFRGKGGIDRRTISPGTPSDEHGDTRHEDHIPSHVSSLLTDRSGQFGEYPIPHDCPC